MQKKTIFFVGVVLFLIVLATWGFYWYQKPRSGVANIKASYLVTATDLYQSFQQNENKANDLYAGKVIEVTGLVDNVTKTDSSLSILLSARQPMGGINCSMAKGARQQSSQPEKGQTVRIKGRCVGFLMDVNLVDAILVPDK